MKVTLINISDAGGGAAEAGMRLLNALRGEKLDAELLVQHKTTRDANVEGIAKDFISRLKAKIDFLYERLSFIFLYEKNKSVRFAYSTANAGTSIKDNTLVKNADILHLHWTNSGFLSVADLMELVDMGKPIVWTLHDMWAFTGGCHYAGDCDHFQKACGDCWYLRDAGPNDISHSGWLSKAAMFADAPNITFVTCSKWLAGVAGKSSLLKKFRIEAIPNPIDTAIFSPQDETDMRANWCQNPFAKVILFGAANIMDRRKGISYLIEALQILKGKCADTTAVEVMIFGKHKDFDVTQIPFPVKQLGIITSIEELVEIYAMADLFVTPSIEDNLPNTIMEALACGTPVVAFNTGGIPEMVDHGQNGYLAEYKSAADLAKGMYEVIYTDDAKKLSVNARNKVLKDYNNQTVAKQYIKVYQSLLD